MSAARLPSEGDTRKDATGGLQVFGGGRWHDSLSEAGRRYAAQAAAVNDDVPLPSSIEAEQALLGALLSDPEGAAEVDGLVQAAHFFEPFHQRLYAAIRERSAKGRACDPALLTDLFRNDEAGRDLGGVEYLTQLIRVAPPTANAPEYAREVASLYARRELVRVGAEIAELGLNGGDDADAVTAEAERLLHEATGATTRPDGFTSAASVIGDALAYARSRSGRIDFSFGIASVDDMVGGLNAGETTLLAARPGMGKTVAAQAVAKANAAQGLGTCFFSLEMAKKALGLRLASDLAFDRGAASYMGETTNPTADKALKGLLSADDWERLEQARRDVASWPLLIDDRPGLTLAQMEAAARRAHRRWAKAGIKPGPIIIDHLGKVRPPLDRRGNRHAEVADVSAGVAEMAKRLGVPVLALVQLNRGVEGRDDKRPVLSDLRQAGELEEDARQVIFLYRPEYYLRDGPANESFEDEAKRRADLAQVRNQLFYLVEKNSHGPRGQVKTFCDIACSAIRDWEGCE